MKETSASLAGSDAALFRSSIGHSVRAARRSRVPTHGNTLATVRSEVHRQSQSKPGPARFGISCSPRLRNSAHFRVGPVGTRSGQANDGRSRANVPSRRRNSTMPSPNGDPFMAWRHTRFEALVHPLLSAPRSLAWRLSPTVISRPLRPGTASRRGRGLPHNEPPLQGASRTDRGRTGGIRSSKAAESSASGRPHHVPARRSIRKAASLEQPGGAASRKCFLPVV